MGFRSSINYLQLCIVRCNQMVTDYVEGVLEGGGGGPSLAPMFDGVPDKNQDNP